MRPCSKCPFPRACHVQQTVGQGLRRWRRRWLPACCGSQRRCSPVTGCCTSGAARRSRRSLPLPESPQADVSAVARVLGASPEPVASVPVAPPLSSRFRLLGLVGQPGQRGAALIEIDGQPPRPVSVGAVVEGQLLLLSVDRREVRVGLTRDDPSAFELSLPEQPE